jgi:hypothetical protein
MRLLEKIRISRYAQIQRFGVQQQRCHGLPKDYVISGLSGVLWRGRDVPDSRDLMVPIFVTSGGLSGLTQLNGTRPQEATEPEERES